MKFSINIFSTFFCAFLLFGNVGLDAQGTEEFEVNGLTVILKQSQKQVISAQLFFKGGTANYGSAVQGVELLALRMLAEASPADMTKDEYNTALESTGTAVSGNAQYDYGTLSLRCIDTYWDDAWSLFANSVCNPSWDEAEFENIKNQMLTNAQQATSDPDTHLRNSAMKNTFADGNYSKIPEGSVESIPNLTIDNAKDYLKLVGRNDKAFLVVVGKISKEDLMGKVEELSCIRAMNSKMNPFVMPTADKEWAGNKYGEENREIATNYIRGVMGAPAIGGKEESAMRVAMSIMGDKMFEEVRTKRNLSYAPAAFFPSGVLKHPYTAMYVSTTKPNETIQVMTDEFRRIRSEGFSETDLINKKGEFLTQFYMEQETNSSQAAAIGRYHNVGDYKRLDRFMDEVNALTVDDLNKVFRKHIREVNWTYLGDTSIVDQEVFLAPLVSAEDLANEKDVKVMKDAVKSKKMKKKRKKKKLIGF